MTLIEPPAALLEHLRSRDSFLLTGHINPDGDSVGSALGLASILESMGKRCFLWNRDETPAVYQALPAARRIHTGNEPPFSPLSEHVDTVIALECPTFDRCGLEARFTGLPVLNLDHHLGNASYGLVDWVDAQSPALGEMILTLSTALDVQLSTDAATVLFVALSSDTGGFRFANATARAFEAAAELVRRGADPTEASRWLHESHPEPTLRLLAEMLGSLRIENSGKVASVLLTEEMFERADASPAHSEGLINHPRSIKGVETVAMVRQLGTEECKVSLRSRGAIDVESIARRHGGGGHRNAAGFVAAGSPGKVRELAVQELSEEIAQHAL